MGQLLSSCYKGVGFQGSGVNVTAAQVRRNQRRRTIVNYYENPDAYEEKPFGSTLSPYNQPYRRKSVFDSPSADSPEKQRKGSYKVEKRRLSTYS